MRGTTFITRRLTLRHPITDDAGAVARYLADFAVAGSLARVPHPYSLADAKAWLAAQAELDEPTDCGLAIDLNDHGIIGVIGFRPSWQGTHLGYWLGRPYWGRGLMTEAVSGAIDWFFAVSGVYRLVCGAFASNAASLAIQRKLGFTETGRSRLLCLARGQELAHIDTQLTRDAWKARAR